MFVSLAHAAAGAPAGGAAGDPTGGILGMLMPLVLMFAVFYFLLIRPQQKRAKQHRAMLDALQKGDDQQQSGGAQGDDPEPHGERLRPPAPALRREAEHRVRDVQGHHGDEKVGRLGDEVGGAVLCRGEIAGVEPDHQKDQQLGAEGADAHQDRVGGQGLILIHAALAPIAPARQLS